jgi:putative membrane protein
MRASPFLVVLTLAGALLGGAAAGQPADSSGRNAAPAGDPATFVRFAASSATLQAAASEQAVRESSRPDVKEFAQHAIQVQRDLLSGVQAFARQSGIAVPAALVLEHKASLDGLSPLTGEEFNRRYMQMEVQALRQAVQMYRAAAERATDENLRRLAGEALPKLEQQSSDADRLAAAVQP